MRLRFGIADVTAVAVVVLVVILELVGRNKEVTHLYMFDEKGGGGPEQDLALAGDIGRLEAQLAVNPGDGEAAEQLANRLAKAGQTDWALRAIGAVAESPERRPERWRALLALSGVHAERIDIPHAYEKARQAADECERERNRMINQGVDGNQSACPDYEQVRLGVYVAELEVGLDAIRRGIDPALDPFEFRRAIDRANPRAKLRGPAPH
jgi:hypothetical protein